MPTAAELLREAVWDDSAHPRAAAGNPTGGQFAVAASSGGAVGTKGRAQHRAPAARPVPKVRAAAVAKPAGKAPAFHGTLAYNPKTNTGPGYNTPHGDPHVHQLQQALNRLGATDAKGRKLVDDGKLGPLTTQAVRAAQGRLGLPQDGKVTPAFLRQLQGLKSLPPVRAKASATAAELLHGHSPAVAVLEGYDPAKHARVPKGQPGGGRFVSMVDRVKKVLEEHLTDGGKGDPFDGFNREQLRRVAKARGIELKRGEDRDSIAQKLLDHLGGSRTRPSTEPRSVHTPGKDVTGWVHQMAERHLPASTDWSPIDTQLEGIIKHQGFDELGQVVTANNLDTAVDAGWTEVWRGVRDFEGWGGQPSKSARAITDELKDGSFRPGTGIYGNGMYTSVRRYTAEAYRGSYAAYVTGPAQWDVKNLTGGADGGLVRMAIDPKAKVVDYAALVAEMKEQVKPPGPNSGRSDIAAWEVLGNPGRFAAARGYDVIRVSGPDYNDGAPYPADSRGNADQYVILNRTVLMIQKGDPS